MKIEISKKLKIITAIIIFIITIIITNNVFALSAARVIHIDPWTGQQELMPQGGGTTANGATVCIKKGGALRYTAEGIASATSYHAGPYILHNNSACQGYRKDQSTIVENIRNGLQSDIISRLSDFEWHAANQGSGVWARYGNGNYNFNDYSSQIVPFEQVTGPGTYIVATSKPYTYEQNWTQVGHTNASGYAKYLLSAGKEFCPIDGFGLKEGNYPHPTMSDQADVNLIQDAVWCSDLNRGTRLNSPAAALELLEEAKAYEKIESELTESASSIEGSEAQVIVNRTKGTYIIGPYKLKYPEDKRFYYVEDLYVQTDTSSKVQAEVISASGNKYPNPGEIFFLEFSAQEAGNPTTASVVAEFAYLAKTAATYDTYKGEGQIGQLVGIIRWTQDYHEVQVQKSRKVDDLDNPILEWTGSYYKIIGYETKWEYYIDYESCKRDFISGNIEERIIGSYVSQDLIEVNNAEREWKETKKISEELDLTIKIGGYVWLDEKTGKTSEYDGIMVAEEEKIPNVRVYLQNGKQTITNAEGYYEFEKLDAMTIYQVTFNYNGQYYQPTYCATKDTWYRDTWYKNSNAKDEIEEREKFNNRFASIAASPECYSIDGRTNSTYTKTKLYEEGIIDKFGNPIGNSNASMLQYVRDCLTNAYTETAYPVPDIFVIDEFQYPSMLTPKAEPLYPKSLQVNLGLCEREESDLALKKDIEKVTLEINNQVHNYEYNSLDTYKCKDCDHEGKNTELVYNELDGLDHCPNCGSTNIEQKWDIGVRLSDEFKYYNTDYSREIYKSDYIYKVDFYGPNPGEFGKEQSEELDVYITYKIALRNQSLTIRTRVDEVVDYFDSDLTYIPERSYIAHYTRDKDNKRVTDKYSVQPLEEEANKVFESIYNSKGKIEGYNNLYIRGLGKNAQILENNSKYTEEELQYIKQNGVFMDAGDTAYAYITFRVNKDSQRNVLLDENNWVLDENGNISSTNSIGVGKENIAEINGYSTIYADGTTVPYIGEDKDGNPITRDVSGKPAGLVDRDSTPGNVDEIPGIKKDLDFETEEGKKIYEQFEDDSDKAPNMRLVLYKEDNTTRVITGNVWEDLRTEKVDKATVGNGIQEDEEILINGVTVQLVELMDNGTEFIWREFENGTGTADTTSPIINAYINGDTNRPLVVDYKFDEQHDGQYAFKSFMPGKYVVRFIYGDTVKTVVPNSLGGMNAKSYNGQDYKSTTYQKDIPQQKEYEWREASTWQDGKEIKGNLLSKIFTYKEDASNNETAKLLKDQSGRIWQNDNNDNNLYAYLYDITSSEPITNVSDAKDIESRRNEVISYSDDNVTNYIAEVLASHKADYEPMNDRNQLLNDLIMNTQMTAETGVMVIELEYDRTGTTEQIKDNPSSYLIQNVNLGLEERPKAQLILDKKVTNAKLTLADGSILFDAKQTATNVLWKDHKAYEITYKDNMFNEIRNNNRDKLGLVQMSMDEELMHGSTIEISYEITVQNYGEVDYYNTYNNLKSVDRQFYYNGKPSSTAKVVTTNANEVIDYVGNNLQFNVADNSDWSVITQKDIKEQGLVNNKLADELEKYNTIISTKKLSKELLPKLVSDEESQISVPLVLTQLITSENDTDDLTYKNITEIVKTSNTNGRRMEYSVVGNQNPTKDPQELDTDEAQIVRILPPFGSNNLEPIIITIIAITALGILVVGIIFIKQKVLTK